MNSEQKIARLRWQCRRGMLELDVKLNAFLENSYQDLSEQEQEQFEALIKCTDQELYTWLLGYEAVPNADWLSLMERIRAAK